jgi:hypothetical protein
LRGQLTRIWRTVVLASAAAVGGVVGAYALSRATGTPVSYFTRDLAAITESDWYIGLLSNVGIMLWAASAGVCFLAAGLLRGAGRQAGWRFLLFAGALSVLLGLDDALMIHEQVLWVYLQLEDSVMYIFYYVVLGIGVTFFIPEVLRSDYLLLLAAGVALGLSFAMDSLFELSNRPAFIEDSFKFAGIVFWLAYWARTGSSSVRAHLQVESRVR